MYEAFFGLLRKPFSASPDPSMYIASESTERALKRLTYAVRENIGGFLLTGPAGCGKTLLLEKLAATGAANLEFLFVRAGKMDGDALAAALVRATGLVVPETKGITTDRNILMDHIAKYLSGKAVGGKQFTIIIDGGEWLDNDALTVLEMLNDIRRDGSFLATFVLSGRESLAKRVLALSGLRDRFALSARLEALDEEGSGRYVKGRTAAAGAIKNIFDDASLAEIFVYAKGVPRRINRVADLALLTAFGFEKNVVDAEVMNAVIDELSQSPI